MILAEGKLDRWIEILQGKSTLFGFFYSHGKSRFHLFSLF